MIKELESRQRSSRRSQKKKIAVKALQHYEPDDLYGEWPMRSLKRFKHFTKDCAIWQSVAKGEAE